MVAEILAVGTEILLGDILNTNARFLSRELAGLGISVYRHNVVGDNPARISEAYAYAFSHADIVIATGGLGPTDDDITKDIAARYFGVPLVLHEESWLAIQRRFSYMNMPLTENNKRQAYLPQGCEPLRNDNGSAPGVYFEREGKTLILLPGPPNELEPMFTKYAVPFLRAKSGGVFISRTLKLVGIGESRAAEAMKDLIDGQTNPTIAPYAKISEMWFRITASAPDEAAARKLIKPAAEEIYNRLGEYVYGEDDDTLASVAAGLLKKHGLTIAAAESCTGGMVTSALVGEPGISDWLEEGLITYSNEAKMKRLGVSEETLKAYGAVSSQTAAEMAEGAARTSGAAIGVSTTGIAGPSGGTDEKPVGLVYMGLYVKGAAVNDGAALQNEEALQNGAALRADGSLIITQRHVFSGDRNAVRRRATVNALSLIIKTLRKL